MLGPSCSYCDSYGQIFKVSAPMCIQHAELFENLAPRALCYRLNQRCFSFGITLLSRFLMEMNSLQNTMLKINLLQSNLTVKGYYTNADPYPHTKSHAKPDPPGKYLMWG